MLRHQNPLNEYTKLEPHWFSLGQSQYDIPKGDLHGVLESVVQECVSCVGVDVNTAEAHLLRYIPGFDTVKAEAVVKYRKTNGPFITRHQLLQVNRLYSCFPKQTLHRFEPFWQSVLQGGRNTA